jgi:hypothetical protein
MEPLMNNQRALFTAVALLLSTSAFAADFVVTRTDDPSPDQVPCFQIGGCGLSLRQAVLAANNRPGLDRILLSRKTYELTRMTSNINNTDGRLGQLRVTDALEIIGHDPTRTRIRWASATLPHQTALHEHQVLHVQNTQLKLSQLALSHGQGRDGGCLRLHGSNAALSDVLIEQCKASSAGGALAIVTPVVSTPPPPPVVEFLRVSLNNNQAPSGGAIAVLPSASIISNGLSVSGNTATASGGAVFGHLQVGVSLINTLNLVWRSEGAGTQVLNNSAGDRGGALALYSNDAGYTNIFAASGSDPFIFENNLALNEGGMAFAARGRGTFENLIVKSNAANIGGGMALRSIDALISQVEFDGNTSQSGDGGAVAINYWPIKPNSTVEIRQSSFNANQSQQAGGAIANLCQTLTVRDSSFWQNRSQQNQGALIASSGNTFLAHVSTAGHALGATSTLLKQYHTACGSQPFGIANSLIAGSDNCIAQNGTFASAGGNQFGPGAGGCGFIGGLDQNGSDSSFQLSLGTFGGSKSVLGWNTDGLSRPQVNFGQAAYCSALDVRGLPRSDGACDAGAFEQQ